MIILSMDVGILNLAYCLGNYEDGKFEIMEWDIINLIKEEIDSQHKCSHISKMKPYNKCSNIAKFMIKNETEFFCKNHLKNYKKYIPPNIIKIEDKSVCQKLECNKNGKYQVNGILMCSSCKKQIETNFKNNYTLKKIKTIQCKTFPLEKIADKIIKILDKDYSHFLNTDVILIENQPAFKNPKMKTLSNYLAMYFRIRGIHDKEDNQLKNIIYYRATRKLEYNKNNTRANKKTYKDRKKTAIENVNYYLYENHDLNNYEFFNNNKKKDDLADALLQILSYINKS
jgi:hypothetical protein